MEKWEYLTHWINDVWPESVPAEGTPNFAAYWAWSEDGYKNTKGLDELGELGWEAVGICPGTPATWELPDGSSVETARYTILLKRPVMQS